MEGPVLPGGASASPRHGGQLISDSHAYSHYPARHISAFDRLRYPPRSLCLASARPQSCMLTWPPLSIRTGETLIRDETMRAKAEGDEGESMTSP